MANMFGLAVTLVAAFSWFLALIHIFNPNRRYPVELKTWFFIMWIFSTALSIGWFVYG